jgi:hypothetical protein
MPVMAAGACRQCSLALDDKTARTALGESLVSRDLEVEFEHKSLIVDTPAWRRRRADGPPTRGAEWLRSVDKRNQPLRVSDVLWVFVGEPGGHVGLFHSKAHHEVRTGADGGRE